MRIRRPVAQSTQIFLSGLLALLLSLGLANPVAADEPPSLSDALVAFSDGILAFAEEDFEAARKHFERAAAGMPDNGEAHYWLGSSLAQLGRLEEAAGALREALESASTTTDKSQIRADLAAVRAAAGNTPVRLSAPVRVAGGGELAVVPTTERFDGRLSLGVVSDSNPWRMSDELILFLPDGTVLDGAESDTVGFADLRLALRAPNSSRWSPSIVGRLRHTQHGDFDQLDRTRIELVGMLARGRTGAGWLSAPLGYAVTPINPEDKAGGRHGVLLQVGATHDRLDGDSELLTIAAAAGWQIAAGEASATLIEGLFASLDYENDVTGPFERSGEDVSLGLSQFFYFGDGAGRGPGDCYLRLGVRAGDHQRGAAATRTSVEVAAEWALPIGERLTLFLLGGRRTDDFDQPESNVFSPTGEPRQDDTTRAGALLAWRLGERLLLTLRGSWTDRDTELIVPFPVPELDYDRTQASIGLSWNF